MAGELVTPNGVDGFTGRGLLPRCHARREFPPTSPAAAAGVAVLQRVLSDVLSEENVSVSERGSDVEVRRARDRSAPPDP
jgi:hypothetical protein